MSYPCGASQSPNHADRRSPGGPRMRSRRLAIVLLALCLGSGCAKKAEGPTHAAGLRLPPYYDEAAIARAGALTDSGYAFLEQGKTAEAIDAFTRQREVLPGGRWSA